MNNCPNILLITDDQHRWDFVEGGTVSALRAPTLARLCREGTTLSGAVTNCPICMPTRMTWNYGLYASQVADGLLRNNHDWPTDLLSMPQALQAKGYHTALIGKLHSLAGLRHRDVRDHERETRERGFEDLVEVSGKSLSYWYDCDWTRHLAKKGLLETYRHDLERRIEQLGGDEPYEPSFLAPEDSMDGFIGREVREWLEAYSDERPFFLHASFCGPHFPFDPPKEYFQLYSPGDMPSPNAMNEPDKDEFWRRRRAAYCAMITQVDEEMGRVMEVLRRRGFEDDTLIIYATDHGDMIGHHNRWGKGTPFDSSVRTPYVLRWPGKIPAGQTLDAPVEAVDLPCSILDAAGLGENLENLLPNTPGRSFLPYAMGQSEKHRDWAYSEHATWRMCRMRDWKYVLNLDGVDALYNLKNDPWEKDNLIENPECQDLLSEMRRNLALSMARVSGVKREPGKRGKVKS